THGAWLRNGLIVGETALSLMLLVGAGLLLRSFLALQVLRPGFDPEGVLTLRVVLPAATYPEPVARLRFYDEASQRLAGISGVAAVGLTSQLPLTGSGDLMPYA